MGNLFEGDNDPAARIAGLIFVSQEDGDSEEAEGVFAMTARVPIQTASAVTVLAEHAGLSRNEMVKLLLKAGIAESLSRLPPELADEIRQEAYDRIQDFI